MNAEEILVGVLEKTTPVERSAYLDGACGPDVALRAQVEGLLKAHEGAGSFLEQPLFKSSPTIAHLPPVEKPGTVIGPYKLLQQIGEGGMGIVFLAEQTEPVRRKVALKIIKPGMDSAQVIARFEAERQALALMDHPSIAKVLDAGTTDSGRPYFVMELVKGTPITDFCDQNRLTPRERLELFVPVCQAIQHAHQKGIIHRDIKPSNVLVTLYDGKPVPKVIDFGIAKATDQRLTERTLFTSHGQIVGTFEYMSPEQATLDALDVDTRSDVYSLAVLLYELLTGTTPLDKERLRQAALGEVLRLIREEEPPRPSNRLSASGVGLPLIAAHRKTESQKLPGLVRGDLDWIVMKGLDKDRTRRYETASALAADVRRYLSEEPVEARPPTAGYRLRKFFKRHRGPVLAGSLVLLAVLTGIAGTTWGWIEALGQRDDADHARKDEAEQRRLAVQSADDAKRNEQKAIAASERARAALYATRANQIQTAWETNNIAQFLEGLEQQRPKPDEPDMRGFEWDYWNRLYQSQGQLRTYRLPMPDQAKLSAHWLFAWEVSGTRFAAGVQTEDQGLRSQPLNVWDLATGKEVLSVPNATSTLLDWHFSQDGTRLAAMRLAQSGAKIVVWDATTGKEVRTFAPTERFTLGTTLRVGLNANGTRLVITGQSTKVFDVESGMEVSSFATGQGPRQQRHVFNPDGTRLLAVGEPRSRAQAGLGSTLPIVDAGTGNLLAKIETPEQHVHAVFSPDGALLATAGTTKADGIVLLRVWDAANGVEKFAIPCLLPYLGGVIFSPDGKQLAAWSGNLVQIWDPATGKARRTLKGPTRLVKAAYREDSSRLYTVDQTGMVQEWDVTAREEPQVQRPASRLHGFGNVVTSPDGSLRAEVPKEGGFGGLGKVVIVRNGAGNEIQKFDKHVGKIRDLLFSPDSRYLYSLDLGGGWKVWDAATGDVCLDEKWPVDLNEKGLSSRYLYAQFSSDGGLFVAPVRDGVTKVWRNFQQVAVCQGGVSDRGLSPDGRRLVTVIVETDADKKEVVKELHLWDLTAGKELKVIPGNYANVQFTPDGRGFVAALDPMGVALWDAATGAELTKVNGDFEVESLVLSPDGKRFAIAARAPRRVGGFMVFEVDSGKQLFEVKGHSREVRSLAFSPDGKRIASLSADAREVKLWDAATGNALLHLTPKRDMSRLSFNRDGTRLIMNSKDMTPLESWDATPLPDKP